MELEINDKNFEKIIYESTKPIIIDFFAVWCPPCKTVNESIHVMSKEYGDRVIVGKVDVDINPMITSKFGVRNMPTVLFVKNGIVLDKHVGATSKTVLENKLQALL